MKNPKCPRCGLVNFSDSQECKRCGALLSVDFASSEEFEEAAEKPPRSLKRKVLAGFGMAALLLFVWHLSLLHTSTVVNYEEKRSVERAIDIIERKGFTKDAFLLRRLANFRTSDNWWNLHVGHGDAYAATNFPFEVVTLYPEFFQLPKDDTERAIILLHEARHLAGADEEEACRSVWRDRAQLGYTDDKYLGTQVWMNVAEYTLKHAPDMFPCGPGGGSKCFKASARGGM